MVRASPEDDDRSGRGPDGERVLANPDRTGHGWNPPFTMRGNASEYAWAEDFRGFQGTWPAFRASLYEWPNGWRISLWGCDDYGVERSGLTEAKARRLWEIVTRPQVTLRTIHRLGFRYT